MEKERNKKKKRREEKEESGEMKPLFLPAHIIPSTRIYERIR
jgi:hypothetical protein